MKRAALSLAFALVAAAPSPAATVTVGIPGKFFAPAQLQVVAGDSVTWRNADHDRHDLVASDGEFGSGLLAPDESYSHDFPVSGTHPYVCTIHASMTGVVDVVPIALTGPASPPTSGERFVLAGRAPAGVGAVTLERGPGDGSYAAVGTYATGPDGSFSASLTAGAAATWRAIAGDRASPPVLVPVAPRLRIDLRWRRTATLVVLSVSTRPIRPGETLSLELYSRERFAWVRAGTAQLDDAGAVTFSVRRGLRRLARIAYAKDGVAVHSRPVALWRAGRT